MENNSNIKNLIYTSEQIKNMDAKAWNEFRKSHWAKKHEIYNDKNNIPDWFWPSQKSHNDKFRERAWIKKCNAYSQSLEPADWFIPDQNNYANFLKKIEDRKQKYLAKNNSDKK